ncbi:putative F-box protein At5g60060 [Prunus avium]|uniref:F-box protein At5g60060 n=1 Tax=Prunus avium TaxID=42229 RepID=A0A6P5U5N8_PRUAV|nr:putative F-box protein At5g60060 [Prunus avium]
MDGNFLDLQLKLPTKRFCGFSKGWLIAMNLNLVITLINPFLRVKGRKKRDDSIIDLPPLDGKGGFKPVIAEFVIKATISADPILDANNCIVVVIYEGRGQLAFIRLNKDTTWTYIDESLCFIEDVVHFKDKFYVVKQGGGLFSSDITTQPISNKQLVAEGMKSDPLEKTYLVVLNDKELWMVQRYIKFEDGSRVTTKFRIFELNFDKYKWVDKKTIGYFAIFLGDNYSISVLASNVSGCQPNCIYFNCDYDRYVGYSKNGLCHDFGVYNVESQRFSKPYTPDAKALIEKTKQPPYWVLQTFQL